MSIDRVSTALQATGRAAAGGLTLAEIVAAVEQLGLSVDEVRVLGTIVVSEGEAGTDG